MSEVFEHIPSQSVLLLCNTLVQPSQCVQVVGLGPNGWLIVVVFVLLAGVIGKRSACTL